MAEKLVAINLTPKLADVLDKAINTYRTSLVRAKTKMTQENRTAIADQIGLEIDELDSVRLTVAGAIKGTVQKELPGVK